MSHLGNSGSMDPIAKLTTGFRVFRDGRFQEQRATYEALVDQGPKPPRT